MYIRYIKFTLLIGWTNVESMNCNICKTQIQQTLHVSAMSFQHWIYISRCWFNISNVV